MTGLGLFDRGASRRASTVCVKNEEYAASLELRRIYQVVADVAAEAHGLVRVIGESGKDQAWTTYCLRTAATAQRMIVRWWVTSRRLAVKRRAGQVTQAGPAAHERGNSRGLTSSWGSDMRWT